MKTRELPQNGAILSPCRVYRYALWRTWSTGHGIVMFIGLNPSTADEVDNDRTVNRCIRFAQRWGYAGIYMANLFAFRATAPQVMLRAADPVGPDNDQHLLACAAQANLVVAAWGNDGGHRDRAIAVKQLLPDLHILRITQKGHPAHPLYLPGSLNPAPWPSPAAQA